MLDEERRGRAILQGLRKDDGAARMTRALGVRSLALGIAAVLGFASTARAQDMPDPSLIHGRAIPASELGNGVVTVRVVREAIGNNIAGQQVQLTVSGRTRTATTDEQGRAEFTNLPSGEEARAQATVDGEPLVSQAFRVPSAGGLRVILVAGIARAAERKKQEEAAAAAGPAVKGIVVFGGNTRVLMQFSEDTLEVYYILEILNTARARVDIGGPLIVDFPPGAQGATALEGSSPSAQISPERVVITGPFASGATVVQVAFRMPYESSTLTIEQTWPAALQQVTVGVEKIDDLSISSPQFTSANDVTAESGDVFALGRGAGLPAGGKTVVTLSNLPVHSSLPRDVALGVAALLAVGGVWLAVAKRSGHDDARQSLVKRRETLLSQLEQLESKRRAGSVDPQNYATRRQRIYNELERVYGELDEVGAGPEGGGEGIAA
jgi:hypothetical protein